MKSNLTSVFGKLRNFNALIFSVLIISLIVFSCEPQELNESKPQHEILKDADFIAMMTSAFVMNLNREAGTLSKDDEKDYKESFKAYFNTLNNRYTDFHEKTIAALDEKESLEYITFSNVLYSSIQKATTNVGGKVAYDGSSFCGRNCGSYNAITTSCITGCVYSETWCLNNGGSNCDAMRVSCQKLLH